jgi:hypothetical protein
VWSERGPLRYERLTWPDGSLKLMSWWSAFSRSGVQGDELLAKPLPKRRQPVTGS